MKLHIHAQLCQQALGAFFSPPALQQVVKANLGQDALRYQVGHDHFHYDSNAFAQGDAYVAEQRQQARGALAAGQGMAARAALGRLTHTAQDFYAHSNYVALWRAQHGADDPEAIDPLDAGLLAHPHLHSGKLYYPLEVLSFIPALEKWVLPLLPTDSHAHMNKDTPNRPDFDLAFHAALKRTVWEFEQVCDGLAPEARALLTERV